ncbi:MAG: ATP-binding protein [Candidatus Latescibacterota bacterium]|nr:ATP-binding protein [Candidatus Latescibacterota bacterium]
MNTKDPVPPLKLGNSGSPLDNFTDSYILFQETTRKYREAYEQLEAQFESLTVKLEDTNIDLQKRVEERDRVTNYLNNILDSMSGGVLVVDLNGDITHFNQEAEDITGYKPSDVLGHPYEDTIGVSEGRELTAMRTLESGERLINREKSLKKADDTIIPLGFSTSLLRDEQGTILGAVEVFNDLTEVKRLEAEIQRVKTLAALGEMAATVAHEIRNPLGGIAGYAGMLERDLASDDPNRRLVHRITEGVGRLNRIVSSLLTYTRPLRLNAHPVNLVDVVEETLAFYAIDIERQRDDIEIQRNFPGKPLICNLDPEQLQQVILNLLQNATQAMPEGGTLSIRVFENDKNGTFCIGDTGTGMDEDVLEKLFTPFFTTKEDGTGLGLVTSKKIIDAHEGEIQVESEPNTGTQFFVTVPKKHTQ